MPLSDGIAVLTSVVIAALVCGQIAWRLGRPSLIPADTVRGTTLVAPILWSLIAVAALATVELIVVYTQGHGGAAWVQSARYLAATASCLPAVALLGARRPLDRAWQAIVAALWLVLQTPAVEWAIARPGSRLSAPWPWAVFLWGLILLPAAHYLPTRQSLPSLLVVAAQYFVLGPYLAGTWPLAGPAASIVPPANQLLSLLLVLVSVIWIVQRRPAPAVSPEPLDRVWRDFRNSFGAFWTLRVAQSMAPQGNGAAGPDRWRFAWQGLVPPPGPGGLIEPDRQAAEKRLRSALWRFVPPAWIDARLKTSGNPAGPKQR